MPSIHWRQPRIEPTSSGLGRAERAEDLAAAFNAAHGEIAGADEQDALAGVPEQVGLGVEGAGPEQHRPQQVVAVRTSESPRLVVAARPEPRMSASVGEHRGVQRRLTEAAEEVFVEELELDAVCRGEERRPAPVERTGDLHSENACSVK